MIVVRLLPCWMRCDAMHACVKGMGYVLLGRKEIGRRERYNDADDDIPCTWIMAGRMLYIFCMMMMTTSTTKNQGQNGDGRGAAS